MKIRMTVEVLVDVGDVVGDDAASLATDLLAKGFKKEGIEIVSIGRRGAEDVAKDATSSAFSVLVTDAHGEEHLLPQYDEYPGGASKFSTLEDATKIAKQSAGLGLSRDDDENKIVSARVVELVRHGILSLDLEFSTDLVFRVGSKYFIGRGDFPKGPPLELIDIEHPADEAEIWGHVLTFARDGDRTRAWETEAGSLRDMETEVHLIVKEEK